jgi:pyridoxamine 5'-phosphate oxidase
MTDTSAIEHPDLLRNGDFTEASEPLALFAAWMEEAKRSEPILLKGFDEAGFVFYTNLDSTKARELRERPQAALLFHWKSLRRQVRIRGTVRPVSDAEADAYFATRARLSQIGAWASKQSSPLESRLAFEKAIALVTARHPLGTIPRPPFWSGFRVAPVAIEFWHDRPFRLHDRVAFTRGQPHEPWTKTRLYP